MNPSSSSTRAPEAGVPLFENSTSMRNVQTVSFPRFADTCARTGITNKGKSKGNAESRHMLTFLPRAVKTRGGTAGISTQYATPIWEIRRTNSDDLAGSAPLSTVDRGRPHGEPRTVPAAAQGWDRPGRERGGAPRRRFRKRLPLAYTENRFSRRKRKRRKKCG